MGRDVAPEICSQEVSGSEGTIHLSTCLRIYKIGDYVDIKVNDVVHKDMPHKFYHGRTGCMWNITKRAIGVEMNKLVIE